MEQTVTMQYAADRLGMSRSSVRKLIDQGILRMLWSGRRIVIYERDIIDYDRMRNKGEVI